MPSYVTPKKNSAFVFFVSLVDQASPKTFKANPTLAAADFNVSGDGGALAALATTPTVTPASGKMVKISLSAAEMNFDNVTLICSDSAGAEWGDIMVNIQTSARQIDDLSYPATSGRSSAIDASGRILADIDTIKTNPVVNAGTVTFPTTATLASTTNITAGTVTTATNVTTVNGLAASVITAASIAASAITSAKFAAGAIDAAAIATDAIDGDAIAASAVTEIQSGLATAAALATLQADSDDIQARLPAALVGGRIDASAGAIAAGAITAAAIATDAIDSDAIAASAVTELQAGLATAAGLATLQSDTDDIQTRLPAALISGRMDSNVQAMAANVVTAAAIADAAIDAATFAAGAITAAAIATDAIDGDAIATSAVTEIQSGLATSASIATLQTDTDDIQGRLPSLLVGGRMDSNAQAIGASVITAASMATGAITAAKFAAGAIDAAAIADGAIDAGTFASGAVNAAAIATDAVSKIRAIVSGTADSGSTTTMIDAARNEADSDHWKGCWIHFTSGAIAGQVRFITAFANGTDTIQFTPATTQAVSTQTYEILPSGAVDLAMWLAETPGALNSGRVPSRVEAMQAGVITSTVIATDAIDADALAADAVAEIQSGLATSASIATLQTDSDDIQARIPAVLVSGRMDVSVGAMAANVVTAAAVADGAIDAATFAAGAITAAVIATDAIDGDAIAASAVSELQAGLATSAALSVVASSVSSVQADAGTILGRLPAVLVGGKMDSSIGALGANAITATSIATGALTAAKFAAGAVDAAALSTDAAVKIADSALTRDMSIVTGEADRSPLNALRMLRNKWSIAAGVLTVTREDDTTAAWTSAITSDAAADPVTASDPA